MLPHQPNQSVLESIRCLQEVAASPLPLGVRDLARRLDIHVTKVNRLLRTMAHAGTVQRNPKGKYCAGPALFVLAAQTLCVSGFLASARLTLEGLRDLGLTVAMGTLWRTHISYIYYASPGADAAEAMGRVSLSPATGSSIGMCLLAGQSDADLRALYAEEPIPGYEATGCDGLLKALAKIRRQGYACVPSLTDPRMTSVGLGLAGLPMWGLAVSGAIEPGQVASLVQRLRKAGAQLGHS